MPATHPPTATPATPLPHNPPRSALLLTPTAMLPGIHANLHSQVTRPPPSLHHPALFTSLFTPSVGGGGPLDLFFPRSRPRSTNLLQSSKPVVIDLTGDSSDEVRPAPCCAAPCRAAPCRARPNLAHVVPPRPRRMTSHPSSRAAPTTRTRCAMGADVAHARRGHTVH